MIKIGVVGNRTFGNSSLVFSILDKVCSTAKVMIVSGGAAGVDSFAERYAKESNIPFRVFLPSFPSREEYFKRNKLIALESDFLIAFIKKRKFRSGSFNTINHFTKLKPNSPFVIINEEGRDWLVEGLPPWLRKRSPHIVDLKTFLKFLK